MGKGRLEGGMSLIKWLMILFNLLFFFVGLLLIICGALIMTKFNDFIVVLGKSFNTAPLVIIVVGVIIFLVAFLGCCGAWKESHCMMMAFSAMMAFLLILQLCAAIAGFVMKAKVRKVITNPLKVALASYSEKKEYKLVFDKIQMSLKCCGVDSSSDWMAHNLTIPSSCCMNSANSTSDCPADQAYKKGCLDKFNGWISSNVAIVAGAAVGVCFVQLIGILCACRLGQALKNGYDEV